MKKETKKIRTRLKIVVATATAIFSLLSIFTATYAWFSSNTVVSVSGGSFKVSTKNYSINSVHLYKYNYALDELGGDYEYLFPEKGQVNLYEHTDEDKFVDVTDEDIETNVMNLYDPLQKIISGRSFKISELNTNAVYKIVLSTSSPITAAEVGASAFLKIPRDEREESDLTYFLSDYVDFDVFSQAELDAISHTLWYPDYDNAPESMAGINAFSGSGDPIEYETGYEGEELYPSGTKGSVYENTTDGSFWVKESYGWEAQDVTLRQGAPSYGYTTAYFINTSTNKVYEYDESILDHTYGNYKEISPTYNDLSTLPDNRGVLNDTYYYHSGSTHQLYKKTSNGWVKRSNVEYETLYYKIAYLASLNESHSHFYNLSPLESISLSPKNDVYYSVNDEWVKLDDYADENSFGYSGGMGLPDNNLGNPNDHYYDYAGNALYIKNSDGGWKSKSAITKISSISDPNVTISFSGSNYPWVHDYGEETVIKGETYRYTGGGEDVVYLYKGNDDAGKTVEANWEAQSIAYDSDSDYAHVSGNAGDYYVYSANDIGSVGNVFLDTANYAVYIKGATWEKQNNVYVNSVRPETGDYTYFIDTDDNSLYIKNGGNWDPVSPTFSRNSAPQTLYINNGNGNEPWSLISPNMYGSGAPGINTGGDNYIYLDTSTNVVYVKTDDGGWVRNSVGINQETPNDYYVDLSPDTKSVTFTDNGDGTYSTTLYINVNYAPSQLTDFSDLLQKTENLGRTFKTYLDFGFSFSFSGEVRS